MRRRKYEAAAYRHKLITPITEPVLPPLLCHLPSPVHLLLPLPFPLSPCFPHPAFALPTLAACAQFSGSQRDSCRGAVALRAQKAELRATSRVSSQGFGVTERHFYLLKWCLGTALYSGISI